MRVISLKRLREFWTLHPQAELPLRRWYKVASKARWASLDDVRRTYPHADRVVTDRGDALTVFNVCGNDYRLITRIRFDYELINVREVLTPPDYDRGNWKR